MKLISEVHCMNTESGTSLDESTGEKFYYIEGIFAQSEKRNGNGRIYPKSVLEEQVDAFQTKIKAKNAYGELDHPSRHSVEFKTASHRITSLKMEGNNAIGRAIVLPNEYGNTLISAIRTGGTIPVSTRGVGSLLEGNIVAPDFRLITIDAVVDPSGQDCFSNGIMEGVEFYLQGNDIKLKPSHLNAIYEQVKSGNFNTFDLIKQYISSL